MKFDIIIDNFPFILKGALLTFEISILAFLGGLVLSIIIGSIRENKNIPVIINRIINIYIDIFRGTPLLIQLFFIYYGLPSIGINLDGFTAGILGLSLNSAAYMTEIIRSGIMAVEVGQIEAAKVLGYKKGQILFYVVYPQAIRIILPTLMNSFSTILKESSLVSVLAITELTRSGQLIYTRTYRAFEIYLVLGFLYFIMTYAVSIISKKLEKKIGIAYEK